MELMDRKEKKEILDLLSTLKLYLSANPTAENPSEIIENTLKICNNSCKRHFSKPHYEEYGEVFESLIQIFSNLDWNNTQQDEKQQIFSLAVEIIEGLIAKLQKDKREIKKEIVFLPYKASMWDCMDTVWQAAYEDKDSCNVHVVPIPYCTFTPEMQVDEWHCEENLPEYVPITHWQDMDLEKLHPDVIVIHNPYDGCNAVTSVDSRYWSSNLKKITDRLIYIPYYTASSIVSQDIIKSPGIANADYVVVDNENVKRQYERCYPVGSYSKDKFVPLGSPKIERVLKITKNDVPLPEIWKQIVGDKPVLLYNTSLGAALRSSEYVCDKLRYVFQKYKNQKAVAFWWRPHPLMKDTLKRLRPNIYDEYCTIEKEYIQEGWGIYDDTPDMDRAIVWGDCYYGDESGVLNTYVNTGKPVVVQDIRCTDKTTEISIWAKAFCRIGDVIWLAHGVLNALFKYDINENKVEFVCWLGDTMFLADAYAGIERVGEKLYFFPRLADNILCYDLLGQILTIIDLPEWKDYLEQTKFIRSIRVGKSIYGIPSGYPYFICFNSESNEIDWCYDVHNLIKDGVITSISTYNERYIICLISGTNTLLWLDTVVKSFEIKHIGNRNYDSVVVIENKIFLSSASENIVDCFSLDDFSSCYCIQDNFGIVRKYDDNHILLDNVHIADWCIIDVFGQIMYRNEEKLSIGFGLKDDVTQAICRSGSDVVFDTNTCKLNIFDKNISVVVTWNFSKEIKLEDIEKQRIIMEYPQLNILDVLKDSFNRESLYFAHCGKNIYEKLLK